MNNDAPLAEGAEQPLLRVAESAKYLGIHPDTLRRWADKGRVAHTKSATGYRLFRRSDLDGLFVEIPAAPAA